MFPTTLLSILAASTLISASPIVERATKLATVYEKCSEPNTVALTFDDGPYIYEGQLVDELNAANVTATFFVNGNNYDCIYDSNVVASLTKALNSGHQIASHTWAHLDLATLSESKITSEFSKTETALRKILGIKPAFMRPPYGSYNNLVRQVAAARNQSMILWDFDSGDSTGSTTTQSKTAYDKLIAKKPKNILALNHEVYKGTVQTVIPYAIKQIKAKLPGYKFVTVAECLGGKNAYQSQGMPGTRDSSWKC